MRTDACARTHTHMRAVSLVHLADWFRNRIRECHNSFSSRSPGNLSIPPPPLCHISLLSPPLLQPTSSLSLLVLTFRPSAFTLSASLLSSALLLLRSTHELDSPFLFYFSFLFSSNHFSFYPLKVQFNPLTFFSPSCWSFSFQSSLFNFSLFWLP